MQVHFTPRLSRRPDLGTRQVTYIIDPDRDGPTAPASSTLGEFVCFLDYAERALPSDCQLPADLVEARSTYMRKLVTSAMPQVTDQLQIQISAQAAIFKDSHLLLSVRLPNQSRVGWQNDPGLILRANPRSWTTPAGNGSTLSNQISGDDSWIARIRSNDQVRKRKNPAQPDMVLDADTVLVTPASSTRSPLSKRFSVGAHHQAPHPRRQSRPRRHGHVRKCFETAEKMGSRANSRLPNPPRSGDRIDRPRRSRGLGAGSAKPRRGVILVSRDSLSWMHLRVAPLTTRPT